MQPLSVRGEGAGLRTLVLELILNALDAIPNGGSVRVQTSRDGATAQLIVTDDGPGVAEGLADALFDPFVGSKSATESGLGLAAAWGIARRHGGELAIGRRNEGGTVATFRVPLSPPGV
jgi:signal transduction histidine kinase